MLKTQAIELLGGSIKETAKAIGITYVAVHKWPDVLTPAMRDRVQAALYRRLPASFRGSYPAPTQTPTEKA